MSINSVKGVTSGDYIGSSCRSFPRPGGGFGGGENSHRIPHPSIRRFPKSPLFEKPCMGVSQNSWYLSGGSHDKD